MSCVVVVRLLSSGYWHVRIGKRAIFQWPRGRDPRLSDGFPEGWVTEDDVVTASNAIRRPMP